MRIATQAHVANGPQAAAGNDGLIPNNFARHPAEHRTITRCNDDRGVDAIVCTERPRLKQMAA